MSQADKSLRVCIANISPVVNEGAYPAKAVIHSYTKISADIFTDGQDVISAVVLIKPPGATKWEEYPMQFKNNDCWYCKPEFELTGNYQFKIQAWINHYESWFQSVQKKEAAQQATLTDLMDGAALLRSKAGVAAKKQQKQMQAWAARLETFHDIPLALRFLREEDVSAFMFRCRIPSEISISAVYRIEVERSRAGFSTWYELFPRSASPNEGMHGTFADVTALLPLIKKRGFDTLYFPPVHPIGEKKRKGKNNTLTAEAGDPGSPWAIGNKTGGHTSIHPQLGTLKDFQQCIRAAKKLDMEIAMDIAFQCAPDHPYVTKYPQWFKWRADGTVQYAENPPKKYEDIIPFNFETEDRENLWNELKGIVEFWIRKGISMFRVDNPHTKPFGFWEWLIKEIRTAYPDVIFLAEAFTRPRLMEQLAKAGFSQSYTYFTWRLTKKELTDYITELTTSELKNYFRPNFWPNTPDILPPHLVHGGETMHIIRLILAATLSSNYGIYGPVYEFAITSSMKEKEEYADNEKYEIKHWDWETETRLRSIISLVNRIRREHSALQQTNCICFIPNENEHILAYVKKDERTNNRLIVVVNLDPYNTHAATLRLPLDFMGIKPGTSFRVLDLLSRDRYTWNGEYNYVELRPYEMPAHILVIE